MLNRRFSVTIIALLLISMLSCMFQVQRARLTDSEIVFSDDFNDGNADGWTQNLGGWSVVNGEYFVSVGIVQNGISTANELSLTDCVIESKLRFGDSEVGYRAGIIFRYTDNEHYYSFEIGNEYDEIDIIKYSPLNPNFGESRTAIVQNCSCPNAGNSSITIDANVEYSLRVEIQGNTFTAYLNGQEVLSWTEPTYSIGKVGLRARRAAVFFDDFTVYSSEAPQSPFIDEFDTPTLDSRWTTVDPDGGSTFDLIANPGWLRITTVSPPGRDLYAGVQNAPHIIQSETSGDFTLETKILAATVDNDEGAGLIVWKDSHTHLRFERISRTIGQPVQQEIILAIEGTGSGGGLIVLSSDLNPTYLRLVRSGQSYSGYYSSDGTTWQHAADATFPVSDPVGIGLDVIHMYHDGTFFTDFDYFRAIQALALGVGDYDVLVNENVTAQVNLENASAIAGGSFDLHFNKSIVNVRAVVAGDFGAPVCFIDNDVGVVKVSTATATAFGGDTAILAYIVFEGLSVGTTQLQLQNAQLNDEGGNLVSPATIEGSITVRQYTKGDLNDNGNLDIGDATLVLRIVVGLEPANMQGDINGNGRIDTGDATLILRKVVGLDT